MRFLAFLDPNSAISRRWRGETRLSGSLDGVLFRLVLDRRRYEASELTQEEIDRLLVRQDKAVVLEAVSMLPDIPAELTIDEPVPDIPVSEPAKNSGGRRRVLRE